MYVILLFYQYFYIKGYKLKIINFQGCATKMLTYLRSKAGIVGGLALPILFVQLLAIVASGCLIKRLEVSSSYFMGP